LAIEHSERALSRCKTLSEISEMDGGILRQYLTNKHKECNLIVSEWMTEAGMTTWQDSVGKQWGRIVSSNPEAKRLVIGSHLDTVPNAGAYDGILGVLLAVELASLITKQDIALPFHLDIVGFCDEEGTRFATTLIGSKALAGEFSPGWLELTDVDGVSMAQAMTDFGLDPKDYGSSALKSEELIAYWEAHIEQGPVLESVDQALGVVTAIAGAKRAMISFIGHSGHAGTTPMHLRKDSLAAAAEFIVSIESLAKNCKNGEVATVGQIESKPGATNVIPGFTQMSLDIRAQNAQDLDALLSNIQSKADKIVEERNLKLEWQWTHQAEAVDCDAEIQQLFKSACDANTESSPFLPSGAGHDAMAVANVCPIGMLFLRSPKGISHHPSEAVIDEDVTKALAVLYTALIKQKNSSL
ncbi:MAG: allantoate amidohydrolase, partial [Vibrio splendidus]